MWLCVCKYTYLYTYIRYVLDVCVHMPKYVIIFWQRFFKRKNKKKKKKKKKKKTTNKNKKQQQQQKLTTAAECVCVSVLRTHIPNKYNEYTFWYT